MIWGGGGDKTPYRRITEGGCKKTVESLGGSKTKIGPIANWACAEKENSQTSPSESRGRSSGTKKEVGGLKNDAEEVKGNA